MHYIPRNASVGPHQVNHCQYFEALLRNNLYRSDIQLGRNHPTGGDLMR